MRDLQAVLFDFPWDGKQSRIEKSVVCKAYEGGGLKIFDVSSFMAAVKIGWLRRINCPDSNLSNFVMTMYPEFVSLRKFGGEYANVSMQRIHNPFFRNVLKHFKTFLANYCPTDVDEFVSECIYYKTNITREKKSNIFLKEWMDIGILLIGYLINTDSKFMSFVEFKRKYPTITKTNFLMNEGVLKARGLKKETVLIDCTTQYQTTAWLYTEKGNKTVQSVIAGTEVVPTAVER